LTLPAIGNRLKAKLSAHLLHTIKPPTGQARTLPCRSHSKRQNMTSFLSPDPSIAAPSPRQLAWHGLEYYGFLHFTVNTFTDLEWGRGDESPQIFHPSNFSASQIAETAVLGGMKGLILTAKHHDGFCLWPSEFTQHSVKNSPWKDGKGDVVAEIAEACARNNLKFGLYLSPWDRNHPEYARPGYIQYYRSQLRELLTRYGPLFEVWFDGANGGDGFYGGQYERREIDARTYYEWEHTFAMIRELQPDACIFGGTVGADVRWVGNEDGIAGDPCWHTFSLDDIETASQDMLNTGHRNGTVWYPAECDVSIRPGWFYHAHEDDRVRSPENLMELYFQSVGRGASLLLNLPPDCTGQIHQRDRDALLAFRKLRDDLFSANLADHARATASSTRDSSQDYNTPTNIIDGQPDTCWSPTEGDDQPSIELHFDQPVRFNLVDLREYLPLGQRITQFAIDTQTAGGWHQIHAGEAVGNRRLVRLPDTTADAVRLRITASSAAPVLTTLGLHRARDPQEILASE
jgi:alpha-L-fucosidase